MWRGLLWSIHLFLFFHDAKEAMLLWLMCGHLVLGSWKCRGNYFQWLEQHFRLRGRWEGSPQGKPSGREEQSPNYAGWCLLWRASFSASGHCSWQIGEYLGDSRSNFDIKVPGSVKTGGGLFWRGGARGKKSIKLLLCIICGFWFSRIY